MAKTFYGVLAATAKYDGSTTAHADVIAALKKHGHAVKSTAAWCSETVMAYFYDAGCIDLIGGYAADSGTIKKHAQSLGIWHSGSSGIRPGDIVLYGRDGKTNHTELAIGDNLNISGNYNGGVYRRKRSGRTIIGYARPKYAVDAFDNLQAMVTACDVMLGVYGSGDTRKAMMGAFGDANITKAQEEVNRVYGDAGKMPFDFAMYVIMGRAGKADYRKKRLGSYYASAQARVNEIIALRTHSKEQAAQDVIAGKYGTEAVRTALLAFNGYDAEDVQALVNKAVSEAKKPPDGHYRIYPVWFFEEDEAAYGDCTAIIEYDASGNILHTVLVDAAMAKCASVTISKLKEQGIRQIDAAIISHGHGDHYGGLSAIAKEIPVRAVYIPNCDGLDKYQKTYANALRRQAAKAGLSTVMQAGGSYSVGGIAWKVLYQADAAKLTEHDSHHMVNNLSPALRFDLGGILYHTAGDMQNEVNNLMVKAVPDLHAHVFKTQWHGDGNATNDALCKAIKPVVAISDYHHKESKGNRQVTRKRIEAVGGVIYRNWEDGDIYIDCQYPKITVKTSKSAKHDTYKV